MASGTSGKSWKSGKSEKPGNSGKERKSITCILSLNEGENIADEVADHIASQITKSRELRPLPANLSLDTKLPSGNLLRNLMEYAGQSNEMVDLCAQGFTITPEGIDAALVHAMECTLPLALDNRTQWTSHHDIRSGLLVSSETILPGTVLAIFRPHLCFRTPLQSHGPHLFNLTCFIAAFLVVQPDWVTAWHSRMQTRHFPAQALGGEALGCYMAIPDYLNGFVFNALEFTARIHLFVAMCTKSIPCNANCGARALMSCDQWDLLQDDVRPNSALVGLPQFPFCGGSPPNVCQTHTGPVPLYCQHPIKPGDILSIVHNSPFVALNSEDKSHPSQVVPMRYLTDDEGIPFGIASSDDRVVKLFGDESPERKALVEEQLSKKRKELFIMTLSGSQDGTVDRQLAWLRTVRQDNDNFDGGPPDPFREYWPCVLPRGALICLFTLAFSSRRHPSAENAKIFKELESFYVRSIESMKWPCILFELWLDLSGMMFLNPDERMYDTLFSQAADACQKAFGVPPDVMLARINQFLHGAEHIGPPNTVDS